MSGYFVRTRSVIYVCPRCETTRQYPGVSTSQPNTTCWCYPGHGQPMVQVWPRVEGADPRPLVQDPGPGQSHIRPRADESREAGTSGP